MTAMVPSELIASELPADARPTASLGASVPACCVHTPAKRVNTTAMPEGGAEGTPTSATLPSADKATAWPRAALSGRPGTNSRGPCCDQAPTLRVNAQTEPPELAG